jgi:hypothetical protein
MWRTNSPGQRAVWHYCGQEPAGKQFLSALSERTLNAAFCFAVGGMLFFQCMLPKIWERHFPRQHLVVYIFYLAEPGLSKFTAVQKQDL